MSGSELECLKCVLSLHAVNMMTKSIHTENANLRRELTRRSRHGASLSSIIPDGVLSSTSNSLEVETV